MGRGGTPLIHGPPRGRPHHPKRRRQDQGESGVSAAVWGGVGSPNAHAPPQGVPIPHSAHEGLEGLGCIRSYVGRSLKVKHTRTPHGAPLSPKRPRQDRSDSGTSAALWGELEGQSFPTPPPGAHVAQTARAGPEGLGCISSYVGRSMKVNHTRSPHGAPLSPKRPRQDRSDLGASAALWGELEGQSFPTPPRGAHVAQTAGARPEGLGCISSYVGRSLKVNHTPTPHGAPLSPKRPRQDRSDSDASPALRGELEGQSFPTPPRGAHVARPGQEQRDSGVSAALWGGAGRSIMREPPHGAPLSPKRPRRERSDSGASASVWGEVGSPNAHGPPTGRPYPPNG